MKRMKASYVIGGLAFVFFTLVGVIIPAFRQMFENLGVRLTEMQRFILRMNPIVGIAVGVAFAATTILKDRWCSGRVSKILNCVILFVVVLIGVWIFLSLLMPQIETRLAER